MKRVVIIGGGAAGMMAAISASSVGACVVLIEKNERLGKKLYITGKGRCNLTNDCEVSELFNNVTQNSKFLYSAIYGYDNEMVKAFFENAGVPLKVERGQRVFPVSDKANDIITALEKTMKKQNVKIVLNTAAIKIDTKKRCVFCSNKESYDYDSLVIATGGCSYESTGSTGDGYKFAKSFGHNIKELIPSLVPFNCSDEWIKNLQGLALKNVALYAQKDNKEIYNEFGELLFTHFGISGPLVLTASSHLCSQIKKGEKLRFYIDLKPALDEDTVDKRLLKEFAENKNKNFENAVGGLFPQRLIPVMVNLSGISPFKKVHEITKEERVLFGRLIKRLPINVTSLRGFNEAIITKGGIDVKEIDPSSMRSKIESSIYFAGEVIDVDAHTGGFNLQIAWSTGYLAGLSSAE